MTTLIQNNINNLSDAENEMMDLWLQYLCSRCQIWELPALIAHLKSTTIKTSTAELVAWAGHPNHFKIAVRNKLLTAKKILTRVVEQDGSVFIVQPAALETWAARRLPKQKASKKQTPVKANGKSVPKAAQKPSNKASAPAPLKRTGTNK